MTGMWSTWSSSGATANLFTLSNCTVSGATDYSRWVDWSPPPIRSLREHLQATTRLPIPADWVGDIELPDGSVVAVKAGNFVVKDDKAVVTYLANRRREFNRYVNASDLLEEFIGFLGDRGVVQSRVLDVPIEVLINWLIMRAAEADGEAVPAGVAVEEHPKLAFARAEAGGD